MKQVVIGFLGCGNVGGGVWNLLENFRKEIAHRNHLSVRVKKVLVRDVNNPFARLADGRRGGLDIIDLANCDSCAFLATQDMGIRYADGSFRIEGRISQSDIRGCNLLVQ